MQVNPDILSSPKAGAKRDASLSLVAALRAAISGAIDRVLSPKMKNDSNALVRIMRSLEEWYKKVLPEHGRQFQRIGDSLERIERTQATATGKTSVAKANFDVDQVQELSLNNLEKLSIENAEISSSHLDKIVELLGLLGQMNPINQNIKTTSEAARLQAQILRYIQSKLDAVLKELPLLRPKDISFPGVQKVEGSVEVAKFPKLDQLERLSDLLKDLNTSVSALQAIKPDTKGSAELITRLDSVVKELKKLPGKIEFPSAVEVTNFPPQKYPMPVTNININPLRGFVKTRSVTVTTSLTPLPGEVLAYRRSWGMYNNSSSTVYIGGSDVTASNGVPVPASTFSPFFDAGPKLIVYGIVSSGTADARVIEISNENIGG